MAVMERETAPKLVVHLGVRSTMHDSADVAPVLARIIDKLDQQADQKHGEDLAGGLQRMAESWATFGRDRTAVGAHRRIYAYRYGETTCCDAEMVDEMLLSQGVISSHLGMPIFPGSKDAGREMAEAWLAEASGEDYDDEDVDSLGRSLYNFARGYFSWDVIDG
jgi:hypothetical protein